MRHQLHAESFRLERAKTSLEGKGVLSAGVVPSGTLQTSDGHYVIIGGNGDSIYSRLMAAVGRPDMSADNPEYANNSQRCLREAEIMEVHFQHFFTAILEVSVRGYTLIRSNTTECPHAMDQKARCIFGTGDRVLGSCEEAAGGSGGHEGGTGAGGSHPQHR